MDKFDLLVSAPLLFDLVFQLVDLLLELLHRRVCHCRVGDPI